MPQGFLGSSRERGGVGHVKRVQLVQENDPRLATVSVDCLDVLEAVVQRGAREVARDPMQCDASGAEHDSFCDDARARDAGVVFVADQME